MEEEEDKEEENEVTGSARTAGLYVEAACSVFVPVCVSAVFCARTTKDDSYKTIQSGTATERRL